MYAQMLPRLQAEEQLRDYETTAAGAGQMKDADRKQFARDLRHQASGPRRAKKASTADLAAIGITVEEEEVTS